MYVLIATLPNNGQCVWGPFPGPDAARKWANETFDVRQEWTLEPVFQPSNLEKTDWETPNMLIKFKG